MSLDLENKILLTSLNSQLLIEEAKLKKLTSLSDRLYLPAQETIIIQVVIDEIKRQIIEINKSWHNQIKA